MLESVAAFARFVRANPLGVVATVDAAAAPEAALVSFAVTESGDLLFDARTDSRKMTNLATNSRVAIVLSSTTVSVQIEGDATIQTGNARREAARIYEDRFRGSRALADGFSIVGVRVQWLRHYDAGVEPPAVVEGTPAWRS